MPRLHKAITLVAAIGLTWLLLPSSPAAIAPTHEEDALLQDATLVLERAVYARAAAVPVSELVRAYAIAVFPSTVKDSQRYYGRGVMSARGATPDYWTPPAVLEFEGAVPLELESDTADFVVIAQTRQGLDHLTRERFISPVIVPMAPGSLGRDTPVRVDADLVAYIQFGGYFAGIMVNDWIVSEVKAANARLYGRPYSTYDIVRGAGFFHLPPAARAWRNAIVDYFRDMS